jgi:hypothetical protein
MNRTVSIAFFISGLCAGNLSWLAAAAAQVPAGGDASTACLEHPTRTCILDQAEEASRAIAPDGWNWGVELLRIAAVHARSGRPGNARALLKSAGDGYFPTRMSLLRDIALAEAAPMPTAEMAAACADEIRRAEQAPSPTSPLTRAEALHVVAREAAKAGLETEAAAADEQAFRWAQAAMTGKVTEKPAGTYSVGLRMAELFGSMAAERARAGDIAFGLTLAKTIGDPYFQARALLAVAREQVKAGSKDAASTLDMAVLAEREDLQTSGSRLLGTVQLLADIAGVQSAAGLDGKAAATFGEAEAVVPWIRPDLDRGRALPYIAAVQKTAGLEDMAAATRSRMLPAARAVRDPRERALALIDAAGTLAKASLSREAADAFGETIELADGIGDPEWRANTLLDIGRAQAKAGDLSGARSTFQAVQSSGVHRSAVLAQLQMEAGFVEDARANFALILDVWRRGEPTPYAGLWAGISRPLIGRLLATVDLQGRQRILEAAGAIGEPSLRAEVLRVLAELEPER